MALRTIMSWDPEAGHYQNLQKHHWEEYRDYIARKPMTDEERTRLRLWVFQGHGVYETPDGRKDAHGYQMSYIDAYREDFIRRSGAQNPVPERLAGSPDGSEQSDLDLWDETPEEVRKYIRGLRSRITALMSYMREEDFYDAQLYLRNYEENAFTDTYWCDSLQAWPKPLETDDVSSDESAQDPSGCDDDDLLDREETE